MPPVDEVSEADVLSMFDKDGDLRDEPQSADEESAEEGQEAEGDEEEETDAEPEAEEEEAEESEDEESEETEDAPELDWSRASPEHKAAHEADQKEIFKLRKDYGKIQSKLHEVSQSRRQDDSTQEELRAGAQAASQWNAILEEHPQLIDIMVKEVEKLRNPLPDEVPEHLKDDPAFQYMKQRYEPYIRTLEGKLKQLEKGQAPLNEWQAEKAQAVNRQKLDGLLDDAAGEFKAMFGKDMTEDDKTAVLKYMVDRRYYESGSNAALAVFGQQYKKSLSAKQGSTLRDKAKRFGSRTKSVNPRRAASAPKIESSNDAIKQALADQGMDL